MSHFSERIGNHLESDFCCPCCGVFGVAEDSLERLLQAEKIAGFDFKILSSYRCFSYNKTLGKKETSSHVVGNAFNIDCSITDKNGNKCLNKKFSFLILNACMNAGFTRIGLNTEKFFIHIDDDMKKRQNQFFLFR